MSTAEIFRALNTQIIKTLCAGIMDDATLLSILQTSYPLSNWDLTTLQQLLTVGSRQGRFLRVSTNPDRWQLRPNMAFVNSSNQVYQGVCSGVQTLFQGQGVSCGP